MRPLAAFLCLVCLEAVVAGSARGARLRSQDRRILQAAAVSPGSLSGRQAYFSEESRGGNIVLVLPNAAAVLAPFPGGAAAPAAPSIGTAEDCSAVCRQTANCSAFWFCGLDVSSGSRQYAACAEEKRAQRRLCGGRNGHLSLHDAPSLHDMPLSAALASPAGRLPRRCRRHTAAPLLRAAEQQQLWRRAAHGAAQPWLGGSDLWLPCGPCLSAPCWRACASHVWAEHRGPGHPGSRHPLRRVPAAGQLRAGQPGGGCGAVRGSAHLPGCRAVQTRYAGLGPPGLHPLRRRALPARNARGADAARQATAAGCLSLAASYPHGQPTCATASLSILAGLDGCSAPVAVLQSATLAGNGSFVDPSVATYVRQAAPVGAAVGGDSASSAGACSGGLSAGAVAGIAVGASLLSAALGGLLVWAVMARQQGRRAQSCSIGKSESNHSEYLAGGPEDVQCAPENAPDAPPPRADQGPRSSINSPPLSGALSASNIASGEIIPELVQVGSRRPLHSASLAAICCMRPCRGALCVQPMAAAKGWPDNAGRCAATARATPPPYQSTTTHTYAHNPASHSPPPPHCTPPTGHTPNPHPPCARAHVPLAEPC